MKVEALMHALCGKFGIEIVRADYLAKPLHGGTLGDVSLVIGTAETVDGTKLPYRVVLKVQKKWERYGDPDSWRREYDLYASDLGACFSDSFRWPQCYHKEMNAEENEISIWMEYIDGVSGLSLSGDMYERAAEALGRFQGRLYAGQPAFLRKLTNLSGKAYAKRFYQHYRSWNVVYDYVRSDHCDIPGHLCQMLIDVDERAEDIFRRIEKLPVVLCHRDFWVANIFCAGNTILLIDWDTAGWGYLGEDIASLIADEADVEHMTQHYRRCIPAYYRGFREYAGALPITDHCVRELILVMFGYRLVEWYINADTQEGKKLQLDTLQKIHEMENGWA